MTSSNWLPFRYRDFHDVPRLIAVKHKGRTYLFDSPFDDNADDFRDEYTVYLLPDEVVLDLEAESWAHLPSVGTQVGKVSVDDVVFDRTKRRTMNETVFGVLDVV
jgi:hypothetical protein